MLTRLNHYRAELFSALIGLFFILVLHFKISYSLIPILLALSGIVLLVIAKKKGQHQTISTEHKWVIGAFVGYFLLFLLSMLLNHGRGRELDLASRALLMLPILALLATQWIKAQWVFVSILLASFFAGISALVQTFVLERAVLFPTHMYIQAGDMAMSLSMFSFVILFYFHQTQQKRMVVLSLIAGLLGLIASFLIKARGAWIGVPVVLLVILYLHRQSFSKRLMLGILLAIIAGGVFTSETIYQRYLDAEQDITAYQIGNSSTSVGARFDMWKSAVMGIQEKPFFGWGQEGAKLLRQQHAEAGIISPMAATFDHAHNQYLQDTLTRGVFGLVALLAIFFVPLTIFIKRMKQSQNLLVFTFGALGITHILLMLSYCLTQSVLSHNSGSIFYCFTTIIFLGLQKAAQNRPLVEGQ